MAKKDDHITILRSYSTIWRYEKKLYSIDSFKLWVPVAINDLLFFAVGIVFVLLLSKLLPFLVGVPWVLRYGAIPFGIMKFFTKMKFDGKLPHKFALGYVEYALLPKRIARFREGVQYPRGRFENIVYRTEKVVNVVEEKLNKANLDKKNKKRRRTK